jgi:hypothetical protein
MFPDLGEFPTGSADHVELADDPPSTKVEADESDDSDLYALSEVEKVWVSFALEFKAREKPEGRDGAYLLVRLRTTRAGPSGSVLDERNTIHVSSQYRYSSTAQVHPSVNSLY